MNFIFHSILVTSSSAKQKRLEIEELYAKKLQDFINETSAEVVIGPELPPKPAKIVKKKRMKMQSFTKKLEYNKYEVERLELLVPSSSSTFIDLRDNPAIFINRNSKELNLNKTDMQNIIESYQAFKEDPESPEESVEAIEEAILEDDFAVIEPLVNEKQVKSKQYSGKYFNTLELEKISKQKSLSLNLHAYIDCCVQNGMINRGFLTLLNYRNRFLNNPKVAVKVNDVHLFNRLIHGYAEKENLQKCREMMNIIQEDKIKPNEQTYANFFECIGKLSENPLMMQKHRQTQESLTDLVETHLNEADANRISTNAIIDKSIFVKDQREAVLRAIRMVIPDFEPSYTAPVLTYANQLVNKLNENILEASSNPPEKSERVQTKLNFSRDDLAIFARQQLDQELTGYVTIKSIQKFDPPTAHVLHYRSKIDELYKTWKEKIITSFNRDLNSLRHIEGSKTRGEPNLLPYLRALDVEDYAEIVLHEIRYLAGGSESYSPTVAQLYRNLGNKVQTRYHKEQRKTNGVLQKTGEIYGDYCEVLADGASYDNTRQSWQRLVHQKTIEEGGPSMHFHDTFWPISAQVGVGKFLYNILMRDLKIDVNCLRITKTARMSLNTTPAFYTLFRHQARSVKEEVKPHPVLMKLYKGSQQETLTFEVNEVPMLCPPQPWSGPRNGGYLIAKSDLIRLPQSARQQVDQIDKTPVENLYPALDSLNQLGCVPWSVNGDLLDIVLHIFNEGGNEKLDVPEPPESLSPPDVPANEAELDKTQKFELLKKRMLHRRRQGEMYSLWCDALYRLSLANHFRHRVFWLPHNMDFRGRVYPIPPHLNHLGSDLARSLLVFHEKKKLGVDGFMWLKLHCINLTGLKKRDSVRERLLFAEEIMDEILDSADQPLTGRMWWTKSDEPWQTLATCIEIAKVMRSGDPENYESSFPIHQDGSCNGLQHYAALGRDAAGAYSVNLAPAAIPQDVYSGIAALVEQAREADDMKGVDVAKILNGFVRRKVIKQTVMTTVYGVTRYGARLQIAKQLKDIDDFPQDWVWPASTYLVQKTFDSLQEMFTSTKEIQDWLTDCARLISATCGQNVQWITPLGLPVVQPYNRHDKRNFLSKNMKLDSKIVIDTFAKPNIMKQKNAFPPNFIHSLDSSHMMLTSLFCERAGLTFVSVHDCFWTHPCTVPDMNRICRDQFVALHSVPILEELSSHLTEKYQFKQK